MTAVGIDACKRGWIAVVLQPSRKSYAVYAQTLDELVQPFADARGFAIDMPLGLPVQAQRRADVEARAFLVPRWASVFFAPVRDALAAPTHAEATNRSKEITGKGVSQQAYALRPKIFEAELWWRRMAAPVWEVHPEVSFAVLLGGPAKSAKTTWAGARERLRGLQRQGIDLDDLGDAGSRAAVDDVLDAAVAAWSASRLIRGESRSFPYPPEIDPDTGREIAIWA